MKNHDVTSKLLPHRCSMSFRGPSISKDVACFRSIPQTRSRHCSICQIRLYAAAFFVFQLWLAILSAVSHLQPWLLMSMLRWLGHQGGEVRRCRSPNQFFPEGTDGLGLDESPCDSSNLNQLHGWIRSGHHCSERRAVAAFVHGTLWRGESARALWSRVRGSSTVVTGRQQKHDMSFAWMFALSTLVHA